MEGATEEGEDLEEVAAGKDGGARGEGGQGVGEDACVGGLRFLCEHEQTFGVFACGVGWELGGWICWS